MTEFYGYQILNFLQLLFGKLDLPIEALRVIEDVSSTPDELQTNFGYIDECGNHPSKFYKKFNKTDLTYHDGKASEADECARAAGIYDCGKNKAPGVTDEIQRQLISDRSTPASVIRKITIFATYAIALFP